MRVLDGIPVELRPMPRRWTVYRRPDAEIAQKNKRHPVRGYFEWSLSFTGSVNSPRVTFLSTVATAQ